MNIKEYDTEEIRGSDYWNSVRSFAEEKHKDQKYGELDYMFHINMVVLCMRNLVKLNTKRGNDLIAAAYCHDLIEDQGVTKKEIAERFGCDVADLVAAVSAEGESRKERHQDTKNKLKAYPDAIDLKLVDRFCNMKCAREDFSEKKVKMYASEVDSYKELAEMATPAFRALFISEVTQYEKLIASNKKKISPK